MPKRKRKDDRTKIPNVYIDTNICRDCIRRRNKDSIHLMEIIRDKKWGCTTSIFTIMELVDVEKDDIFFTKKITRGWEINHILRQRYDKDLNREDFDEVTKRIRNFFENYNFIELVTLTNEGWDLALDISSHSNLFAPDVIHLATAWQAKCNVIITSDEQFLKESKKILKRRRVWRKLRICKPNQIKETLKELGIRF